MAGSTPTRPVFRHSFPFPNQLPLLRTPRLFLPRLDGLRGTRVRADDDDDADNDADDDDDDVTTLSGEVAPFGDAVQHCGGETPPPPYDEHLALPSLDPHSPAAWQAQRQAQQRARQHQRLNDNRG